MTNLCPLNSWKGNMIYSTYTFAAWNWEPSWKISLGEQKRLRPMTKVEGVLHSNNSSKKFISRAFSTMMGQCPEQNIQDIWCRNYYRWGPTFSSMSSSHTHILIVYLAETEVKSCTLWTLQWWRVYPLFWECSGTDACGEFRAACRLAARRETAECLADYSPWLKEKFCSVWVWKKKGTKVNTAQLQLCYAQNLSNDPAGNDQPVHPSAWLGQNTVSCLTRELIFWKLKCY